MVKYVGHMKEVEENITDMVWSIVRYTCHVPWKSDLYWENANCRRHKAQPHFSICFFRVMQATTLELMKISGRLFWLPSSTEQRISVLNAFDSYCRQSKSYLVTPHVTSSIFSTFFNANKPKISRAHGIIKKEMFHSVQPDDGCIEVAKTSSYD
jgi:hypothetical protein